MRVEILPHITVDSHALSQALDMHKDIATIQQGIQWAVDEYVTTLAHTLSGVDMIEDEQGEYWFAWARISTLGGVLHPGPESRGFLTKKHDKRGRRYVRYEELVGFFERRCVRMGQAQGAICVMDTMKKAHERRKLTELPAVP